MITGLLLLKVICCNYNQNLIAPMMKDNKMANIIVQRNRNCSHTQIAVSLIRFYRPFHFDEKAIFITGATLLCVTPLLKTFNFTHTHIHTRLCSMNPIVSIDSRSFSWCTCIVCTMTMKSKSKSMTSFWVWYLMRSKTLLYYGKNRSVEYKVLWYSGIIWNSIWYNPVSINLDH